VRGAAQNACVLAAAAVPPGTLNVVLIVILLGLAAVVILVVVARSARAATRQGRAAHASRATDSCLPAADAAAHDASGSRLTP
jgi:ABC-type transport system involved in cytochrome bd biosynthesis fused ATPase/permease subunit